MQPTSDTDTGSVESPTGRDGTLFSEEFRTDPYGAFARWRDEQPIWWSERLNGHVLSRYDDVKTVLTDYKRFKQSDFFEGALVDAFQHPTLPALDPPRHTDVRGGVQEFFRPSVLTQRMSETVTQVVDELMVELASRDSFDVTADVCKKLVMRVMAALLGSDSSDDLAPLYHACTDYLKSARIGAASPEIKAAGREAAQVLLGYMAELRDQAVVSPGSNLITDLTHSRLEVKDVLLSAVGILLAGVETTVRGLTNTMYALLTHPEAMVRVKEDDKVAYAAFEEGLRWISPLNLKAREARVESEFHGVTISPGQQIFVVLGAANRDPRHYANPDDYDLSRRNMDHMAFGSGIHYCLGAPLARLEGATAISALLRRFPKLSLEVTRPPEFDGPVYRSPRALWVKTA